MKIQIRIRIKVADEKVKPKSGTFSKVLKRVLFLLLKVENKIIMPAHSSSYHTLQNIVESIEMHKPHIQC